MNIQGMGTGCKTCKTLHERVLAVVHELGIDAEVEYVTDVQKIIEMGFMQSPVLLIEGRPPIVGKVPSVEELTQLLRA